MNEGIYRKQEKGERATKEYRRLDWIDEKNGKITN